MEIQKTYQAAKAFFRRMPYDKSASRWETTSDFWLGLYVSACGFVSFVFGKGLHDDGLPFLAALAEASFAEIMRPKILFVTGLLCIFAQIFQFFTLQFLSAQAVLQKRQFGV